MILRTGTRKNYRIWFLPTSGITSCGISQGEIISVNWLLCYWFFELFLEIVTNLCIKGSTKVFNKRIDTFVVAPLFENPFPAKLSDLKKWDIVLKNILFYIDGPSKFYKNYMIKKGTYTSRNLSFILKEKK